MHLSKVLKAKKKPLYLSRPVLNAEKIIEWAKGVGLETTLPPSDLHVTVVYSKQPVLWEEDYLQLIAEGGERSLRKFGDALVLTFESEDLQKRHKYFQDRGASWDHPTYVPHITLTYKVPKSFDLEKVEPYLGPIELGPEVAEGITENWADGVIEKMDLLRVLKANPYHDERGRFATKDTATFVSIGSRFAKTLARDSKDGQIGKGGGERKPIGNVSSYVPKGRKEADKALMEQEGNTLGSAISAYAEENGITVEQAKDKITDSFRKHLSESSVYMRAPNSVLVKILDEGFKNQYETNSSGGLFSPGKRQEFEESFFGLEGREGLIELAESGKYEVKSITRRGRKIDMKPSHLTKEQESSRPVYGYLSKRDEHSNERLAQYGEASIKFKSVVKENSTFTTEDSLDISGIDEILRVRRDWSTGASELESLDRKGDSVKLTKENPFGDYQQKRMGFSPVNDPDYRSAFGNFRNLNFKNHNGDPDKSHGYFEAQIHKKPSVADIESVYFHKPPSKSVLDKLKKLGIKYRIKGE